MGGRLSHHAIRDATLADAPALATLFVEGWRDEHAGLLPEAVLAARSRDESEANWRRTLRRAKDARHEIVLVAGARRLEGLIVSVRQAGDWPDAAEVLLVQVARSSRRRAVGEALMRETAARLRRNGAEALIVRVLEANGAARRFYEALGGELAEAVRQVEESGVFFPERTYVWSDIRRLAGPGLDGRASAFRR
jgi:ribosomal protein S18 acetylase RimI-like enzyme